MVGGPYSPYGRRSHTVLTVHRTAFAIFFIRGEHTAAGAEWAYQKSIFLDLVAVSQVMTTAYEQREKDVVTDMARACSFVNPKYLFCDVGVMFTCQGASEACTKVIHD